MKVLVFRKLRDLVTIVYGRIFHEKLSDEVRRFLNDLFRLGFATIIATIFSFVFSILGGRILGPSGYGEFALVQSVAMFLCIPMTLGFGTALVKYNAEKDDFNRQQIIISTTYLTIFTLTGLSIIIYYLFSSQIAKIFSVSSDIFYLSIPFAFMLNFYTVTTNTLRSLHDMKNYSIYYQACAILSLLILLILFFLKYISYKSVVLSLYIAYGITGGIILLSIRKYLTLRFDMQFFERMLRYGGYATIGGISSVAYSNIDKLLINSYLNVNDVGIYRVYYSTAVGITGLLFGIINTALFPVASKYKSKLIILIRIDRLTPYLIGLGLPLTIIVEIIILKLYGNQYPINFSLILMFAVASILIGYYSILDWIFCSEGMNGIKLINIATIIVALLNLILNFVLIPRIGFWGAIDATIIAFSVGIILLSIFRKKIV